MTSFCKLEISLMLENALAMRTKTSSMRTLWCLVALDQVSRWSQEFSALACRKFKICTATKFD